VSAHLDRAAAEAEAEALLVGSRTLRRVLWGIGAISFGAGLVGVVLPLIPTTPFLLLSAALWARSSKRFYVWLLTHPTLGPPVASYRREGCIPRKAKVAALTLLAISLPGSAFLLVPLLHARIALLAIGTVVFAWILSIPSCPPTSGPDVGARPPGP